jgi:hypothetical protein
MELKIGGIYEPLSDQCRNFIDKNGKYISITKDNGEGDGYDYEILDSHKKVVGRCNSCFSRKNLKLISSNNQSIIMNIKEKFTLAFKSEPEKSFRKAGITNGDDHLTEEGQAIFLLWLLKKNGTEFKETVVDLLLKEKEEDAD